MLEGRFGSDGLAEDAAGEQAVEGAGVGGGTVHPGATMASGDEADASGPVGGAGALAGCGEGGAPGGVEEGAGEFEAAEAPGGEATDPGGEADGAGLLVGCLCQIERVEVAALAEHGAGDLGTEQGGVFGGDALCAGDEVEGAFELPGAGGVADCAIERRVAGQEAVGGLDVIADRGGGEGREDGGRGRCVVAW